MIIKKKVITCLEEPYAIKVFNCVEGKRIFVASQVIEKCVMFNSRGEDLKIVWENNGGTMALWPLNEKPDFLAVQGFFKGFNANNATITKVIRNENGSFDMKSFIDLPYVHRICTVNVKNEKFLIAATLCEKKEFRNDWSSPGMVYIYQFQKDFSQKYILKPLIKNITKNHGMFIGKYNRKDVVMITGEEGVYEICLPIHHDDEWKINHIFNHEVSDISVFDIDQDGIDEIITIEKFHGNSVNIYKYIEGNYSIVYSFPVSFGHVVWSGNIFGKPSIILGYRGKNGALILLRKKPGKAYKMDIIYIDDSEGPANIDVLQEDDVFLIYSTSIDNGRVILYELSESSNKKL